jgi:amino acid adenylation domain-containing protein
VHVTFREIEWEHIDGGQSIIGKPIPTLTIYILDKDGQLAPVGVAGELHVGGAGLARGYLNRPELTAERFIANPFTTEAGQRLYRTGDLGRWQADGNIEYLGRIDDQVKIRGFRIELGEIENALNQSEQVSQAVVLTKGDSTSKRLVGYVVPTGAFDKQEIQNYLSTKLPDYMVPALWVELESIPLTSNGKVNKKALPDPELADMVAEYVAPRNATEQALANIWQELLGLERVGIYDNFFELGGHSLLAMRVISAIRKELNVELSIRELFVYPVIASLSANLDKQNKGSLLPSIVAEDRPEYIPLSFSQERLWFIDQLEGSVQYHMPTVLRLKGELNYEILANTLWTIINRHEVLRTVILEHESEGYQQIMSADDWRLDITEKLEGGEKALSAYIGGLVTKPFNLSKDYMLRANLIKVDKDDHILVATMHHIASDGWSLSVLVKEVIALYEGHLANVQTTLPALPVQYADYAIWQRKYLQGELLDNKLSYWKTKLKNVATLQLPSDYNRPTVPSSRGAKVGRKIDNELSARLLSLAHQQGTTLYMTLLAVFKVLLYRYSGQEDICVGTPIAGRNRQELEGLIGFFVNTLAMRSQLRADMSFNELLQDVKTTTLEAYSHEDVPFEKVVDTVVKVRDRSRNPLFQVMFILQNTPDVPELKLGGLTLSGEGNQRTTSQFDITFVVNETSSGIQLSVEYSTDLYREATIDRMISHYINLLSSIVTSPAVSVSHLRMLTEREEQTLLESFNETAAEFPNNKSIIDLFETQVEKRPEAVAVVFDEERLTYSELNRRSNQVAHFLQKQGITAETLVPICVERSLEMLIGILGIMKAGGTYVPIDPDYPADRISYMLEDSGAELALSSKSSREKLGAASIRIITLDEDWAEIAKEKDSNPTTRVSADQLAYVIYTSGSTGKPKGVMIEHGSVVNLLVSIAKEVDFTVSSKFLSVTTYSFDICYLELFVPLISGAELVIVPRETASDGFRLMESLATQRPTHMQATPSTWQMLADGDWKNEEHVKMLIGGEAVKEGIKDYLAGIGEVWNVYGPTETTIWSAIKKLSGDEKVTIGKPLSNTQIYIISSENELNPVGVNGEICIGGAGLARGYWRRPELTAEKFIEDPFTKNNAVRLYRTGDLGRWLPDGNIECLGRIDDQVKIRGYRIELGEIDSVLNQIEQVKLGVVVAKADTNGNKRLVGYVVPKETFDKQAIQSYLATKLPEFMVPALWVELDQIPLTANGKIDRKALPDPGLAEVTAEYTAPRNNNELVLTNIWQRLLGIERVGIYDDFFELGGHSLLAMRMIANIRKSLGIGLPIGDVFVYPNIAGLAKRLESEHKNTVPLLIPMKTTGNKPALYIVCGSGGTVLKFANFVKMLDEDQPVYGLQQPTDSNDLKDIPNTTEGIAEMYVNAILKQNPNGPYALSGHCFGGKIAIEMAKQLKAIGKKVSLVALFDVYTQDVDDIVVAKINNYYNIGVIIRKGFSKILLKAKFETFLLLKHPKQSLQYKIRKLKSLLRMEETDIGELEVEFNKVTDIFKMASVKYQMNPYDGEILVFYAKERHYFSDWNRGILYKKMSVSDDRKYSWKKYVKSVKVYEIDGEHSTIFDPKNAAEFSRILQQHLKHGFNLPA